MISDENKDSTNEMFENQVERKQQTAKTGNDFYEEEKAKRSDDIANDHPERIDAPPDEGEGERTIFDTISDTFTRVRDSASSFTDTIKDKVNPIPRETNDAYFDAIDPRRKDTHGESMDPEQRG